MHDDAGMFTTLRVALSECLRNGTSVMHMIVADKDGPAKADRHRHVPDVSASSNDGYGCMHSGLHCLAA